MTLCLGARVRIKKTGILGTVQFEAEVVPAAGSTGARLGMYPIIAIEIAGDDGAIYWPLTADDVELCADAGSRWNAAAARAPIK